jgi:hypothetical protein
VDERVAKNGFELRDLPKVKLTRGSHSLPAHGLCLMELVAWIAGERHSGHPNCACPALSAYGRALNDLIPGEWRDELLLPIAPMLIGTVDHVGQHKRVEHLVMTLIREILPSQLTTPAVAGYVDPCKSAASLAEAQEATLLAWNSARIATINVPTTAVSGFGATIAGRLRPNSSELSRDVSENGTISRICKRVADAAAFAIARDPVKSAGICAEVIATIGGLSEPVDGAPLYWSDYPDRKHVWIAAARAFRESVSRGRRDPGSESMVYWVPQAPKVRASALATDPRPGVPRYGSLQMPGETDPELDRLRDEVRQTLSSAMEEALIRDGKLVYSRDPEDLFAQKRSIQ